MLVYVFGSLYSMFKNIDCNLLNFQLLVKMLILNMLNNVLFVLCLLLFPSRMQISEYKLTKLILLVGRPSFLPKSTLTREPSAN